MKQQELWNVSTALTSTPAGTASFTTSALLIDDAVVPVDAAYRIVTKSDRATVLANAADALSWTATLWSQNYNPANAYICRWASAATASYAVMENATTTAATYAALTSTGQFGLTEGTATAVEINPDFSGDTTMGDVASSVQTAIAAAGGLTAAYTCTIDAMDRLTITSDQTGASASAVAIQSPLAGTDLTGALYFGASTSVAGLDIETQAAAMNRVLAKTDQPYVWCQRGGSVAQVTAFSTAVNALNKIFILLDDDATAKTSGVADAGYAIEALSHARTYMIYSEHTTAIGASANQNADAAVIGEVISRPNGEGKTSAANTLLAGVSESGLATDLTTVIPLTVGERTFLEGKEYDYLIEPVDGVHLRHGTTAGGQELRVMIARDYFNYNISLDMYSYCIAQPVVTFSDRHLSAFKSIIKQHADTMVERQVLDADYTISMPLASSFSAATKATHTLTLSDVLAADVQVAINDGVITMSWAA